MRPRATGGHRYRNRLPNLFARDDALEGTCCGSLKAGMSPERRDGAELRATAGFDFAGRVGGYWGWTAGPAMRGEFSEGEAGRGGRKSGGGKVSGEKIRLQACTAAVRAGHMDRLADMVAGTFEFG